MKFSLVEFYSFFKYINVCAGRGLSVKYKGQYKRERERERIIHQDQKVFQHVQEVFAYCLLIYLTFTLLMIMLHYMYNI
jgi:Trk-type K+ transport system membrane component